MNPHKYFVSADLINNPLCGIGTYKDVLNLATGQITREIKKLTLTGVENNWGEYARTDSSTVPYLPLSNFKGASSTNVTADIICTHYQTKSQVNIQNLTNKTGIAGRTSIGIIIADESISTLADFKAYLADQYANGIPVTIWYVLETPETEQITVPSGLSGTVEGYLIQDGTPTPEAPIYPTANTAKGWYNINEYKRSVLVWNTDTAYQRSDGSWT